MKKDAYFGDETPMRRCLSRRLFFPCAPPASCHIPLSLNDPIVQWPRTPPFHGGNTGSNPVRVALYTRENGLQAFFHSHA